MTDTEGLEAMKARHREELAEWRTRCERAEADNAALVERAQHVLADDSDEAWTALAECVAAPHPGAALLDAHRKADLTIRTLSIDVDALNRTCQEHEERLRKAEQEVERLTTATSTLDAMRTLAERERDAARREAALCVESAHDSDARAEVAREEGRREGLEQAAKTVKVEAHIIGATGLLLAATNGYVQAIRAIAARPTQEAPRQDEFRDPDMEESLTMTPDQVEAELRKAGVDPEAFSKRCGALVERVRARQSEPPETSALFAAVREVIAWAQGRAGDAAIEWLLDDCADASEALSALERRMGAMARAVRALHEALWTFLPEERREWSFLYHKSGCACLSDEETDCSCKGTEQGRLVNEALKAFRDANDDAPPVFTLEEVAEAMRYVETNKASWDYGTDDRVSDVRRRLLELAGGKP